VGPLGTRRNIPTDIPLPRTCTGACPLFPRFHSASFLSPPNCWILRKRRRRKAVNCVDGQSRANSEPATSKQALGGAATLLAAPSSMSWASAGQRGLWIVPSAFRALAFFSRCTCGPTKTANAAGTIGLVRVARAGRPPAERRTVDAMASPRMALNCGKAAPVLQLPSRLQG